MFLHVLMCFITTSETKMSNIIVFTSQWLSSAIPLTTSAMEMRDQGQLQTFWGHTQPFYSYHPRFFLDGIRSFKVVTLSCEFTTSRYHGTPSVD